MLAFYRHLRGIRNTILLTVNLVVFACLTVILAALTYLIPVKKYRHKAIVYVHYLPQLWFGLNKHIVALGRPPWAIEGTSFLKEDGLYLLICNHQSWADIIALGAAFNHKIPLLKFFMKKSLLWQLPIAGLACWMLGYPFMARHSREKIRKNPALKGQDIRTTIHVCQKFKQYPATVMNFVEGTRFTPEKHSQKKSPYAHLLPPKTAGIATVMNAIPDDLTGLINATLYYPEPTTLWQFVCGATPLPSVHYSVLPITTDLLGDYFNDRTYRMHIRQWLNQLWVEKDAWLAAKTNQSLK